MAKLLLKAELCIFGGSLIGAYVGCQILGIPFGADHVSLFLSSATLMPLLEGISQLIKLPVICAIVFYMVSTFYLRSCYVEYVKDLDERGMFLHYLMLVIVTFFIGLFIFL